MNLCAKLISFKVENVIKKNIHYEEEEKQVENSLSIRVEKIFRIQLLIMFETFLQGEEEQEGVKKKSPTQRKLEYGKSL